jgi:tRNA G46 methylase TrmB
MRYYNEECMRHLTENDLPDDELSRRLADALSITELKIGISIGQFFCRLASLYRDRFFVGLELKPLSSYLAASRALKKSLTNGVVINIEAYHYISTLVLDDSFNVIHVYFPTPYPSALGLSHRLINSPFVEEAFRVLKPRGVLRIATDDKNYYAEMCELFDVNRWQAMTWQPLGLKLRRNHLVGTKHEMKYRREKNTRIYTLQMMRIAQG